MTGLFGLVVLLFLVFMVFAAIAKKRGGSTNERWPYKARKQLLTEPEQVLYWRLDEALPGLVVLGQVALNRVIEVEKGAKNFMSWFGKIGKKSLDYVVCRKDGSVLVAVELDDASHNDTRRQKGDQDKSRALESAGVPLIRYHVRQLPDVEQIRRDIAPILMTKQQGETQQGKHGHVVRSFRADR